MDYNSNPMLKSGMRKIAWILFGWLILEIACFIVAGYFIGGWNVFWIQFGTLILGYILKPSKTKPSAGGLPMMGGIPSGRGIASTMLMIPGFITDVIGLLMLIPPVRGLAIGLITRRMMPKATAGMFGGGLGDMFSQMDPALLEKMAQQYGNLNGGQGASEPGTRKKRKARVHKDVIDVDAEVQGQKRRETHAEVVRPASRQPKALSEDIIDVNYEIEQ